MLVICYKVRQMPVCQSFKTLDKFAISITDLYPLNNEMKRPINNTFEAHFPLKDYNSSPLVINLSEECHNRHTYGNKQFSWRENTYFSQAFCKRWYVDCERSLKPEVPLHYKGEHLIAEVCS